MFYRSLRWRLQVWHGLLFAAAMIAFGVTAYQLERSNRLLLADQDLDGQVQEAFKALREGRPGGPGGPGGPFRGGPPREGPPEDFPPADGLPPRGRRGPPPSVQNLAGAGAVKGFYYAVWLRNGLPLFRSTNTPADVIRLASTNSLPGYRTVGRRRESFVNTPPGEFIVVGRSLEPEWAGLRRFALLLSAAGAGLLGVGLTGGWFLATRAIRPIADISATARRISGGNLAERVDSARMDTELGQLAGVLNETFTRLEATFAQQQQFTADASHELRTPVSVILSQTQTALLRARSPDEYRESLEACQRAAQRMRALIESLLELARMDAGKLSAGGERVDLATVVQEALELVRPLGQSRRLRFHLEAEPVTCRGEAARLGQVLVNLLTNAINYNRDDGEVRLRVGADAAHALVEVSDTGIGVAPADRPHLFERFFRADAARTRGGAGLGLAIVQAIVQAHGGTLGVTSEVGVGTTFTVRLPRG